MYRHLELFSGTHSFGKVSHAIGYEVFSLDRDLKAECPFGSGYKSQNHIQEDIMTWNYKKYPKGHFHLITASPVCLWWSKLRMSNIGKKLKGYDKPMTREMIDKDIEMYGMPMVDKVFEIIEYFNPEYFIIENPQSGRMKEYIPQIIPFYDIDYCKYSDWGYKKGTRFWTNIKGFEPKICKKDCENMNGTKHRKQIGHRIKKNDWGQNEKIIRYRIPEKLIISLFSKIL